MSGAMTPSTRSQSGELPQAAREVAIFVNGEGRRAAARTIAELIQELGYGESKIATALNGTFVPVRARAETAIGEGDHIEIVAPRQGG